MPTQHASAVGIRAQGWGWRHAGRSEQAVHDLELRIEPGERVLLLGPSGAGKSTLLHALAGVLGEDDDAEQSGSLLLDGAAPWLRRGAYGLMQQDPDSQLVLSRLGDEVAFGAENVAVPRDDIWPRVRQALDDVGLGRLPLDHPTAALSGGQKQRLALAGLLAMRPGLLLLDEPTANLDPAGVLEVRDAVARAVESSGATLVVVEHRVAVWKHLVNLIIVLAPGRDKVPGGVLLDGPPDEVLDSARGMLAATGIWVPGFVPATRPRTSAGRTRQETLLTADDLSVSRDRPRRRMPAVPVATGLDAKVQAGEALTVTGANGTGKSTFALTLAGLLPPAGGSLLAAGLLAGGAGPHPFRWKALELISRIGTVFQEPEHQFVTGNVLDELRFGPRHLGRGEERVEELLSRLRLDHLVDANPYTLSGGEKRRLSVATVLAASPRILILDEPTFGQDANTWAELASFLSELLDEGTGIVSVTHDAEFSAALQGTELCLGGSPVLTGDPL